MKNKLILLIAFLIILTMLTCSCNELHKGGISDTVEETPTTSDNQMSDQADSQTGDQTDDGDSNINEPCQHTYGEWETVKQATCKKPGERSRACSICFETEKEFVPQNDAHTPVTDAAVAASCKNTGLTEGSHCSVCNKVLVAQTVISKTEDHTPVTDAAVAASCKNTGLTEGSHCSVCNKVLVAQTVISKTEDHTPVTDAAVAASCKNTGLTEGSHCSVCNTVFVKQQTIPKADHEYKNYVCKNCGDQIYSKGLSYEKVSGGYKLIGLGSCTDTDIIVPSTYNGQPVLSIGSEAFLIDFASNEVTKSIILCEGIKTIEEKAFALCEAVELITLPDSIEAIGAEAFLYNKSLKSIIIPEKVTVISKAMFRNCRGLKSITLGSQITTIENWAFHYCGIESLTLPDTVTHIGQGAFLESSIKSCNIPKNLTYLGIEAFYKSDIEEIVFGGNLAKIPARAFKDCDSLKFVTFNSSIKKIGEGAFNHASNLETVIFSIGLTEIEKEAFCFCPKITKLLLPNGLLSIGVDAFRYNEAVTELQLPSTLKKIGKTAFIHCKNLKTITIPSSLTECGRQIFDSCGFESVVFEDGVEIVYTAMFINCKDLTSISFSKTLKEIQSGAFSGCTSLVISSLPDSLVSVSSGAFEKCTFRNFKLTEKLCKVEGLFARAYIDGFVFDDGITEIADWMFSNTNISAIEIPEGVMEIGEGAFNNCKSLSSVVFPSTLTHIHQEAFIGCDQISTLALPDNLAFIGTNAFDGLKLIQQVVLPRSLEEIGKDAFANCSNLSEITVPNINLEGVFASGIRTVHFYGTKEEAQTYICKAFPYSSNATIYCIDGIPILQVYSHNVYGTNISWVLTSDGTLTISGDGEVPYLNLRGLGHTNLITKLVIGEGITKINSSFYDVSSFEYCPYIAEIEFPSTLVTIDKKIFKGTVWYENFNSGTTAVYIGDTLAMVPSAAYGSFTVKDGTVTIAKHAFYECTELTEIKLPLTVTTIEEGAFYGCEKLSNLTLHEGIETINRGAISNCNSLIELTIPSTVKTLLGAISSCENLKKVVLADNSSLTLTDSIVSYCDSIETVVIGTGITEFPINTLYDCPMLKYVIVRDTVTKIDYSAFWNTPSDRKFLCYSEATAELLKTRYPDDVYIYSENEPSTDGLFWRFSENGDIEIY